MIDVFTPVAILINAEKLKSKGINFVDVGTYDIAETCPILTFTQ